VRCWRQQDSLRARELLGVRCHDVAVFGDARQRGLPLGVGERFEQCHQRALGRLDLGLCRVLVTQLAEHVVTPPCVDVLHLGS